MNVEALALYLVSPFQLSLLFAFIAVACVIARRARAAVVLAGAALAILWLCSTPWLADALESELVSHYPVRAPQDVPAADAILVLGGAVAGARPPGRPTLVLGASANRVWYAAALYRAGKGRHVVVAAGNVPGDGVEQVEADAIAEMLVLLGVPPGAIVQERGSRNTRENARNVLPLLERLGVRRTLLVTSAEHMPRAVLTFAKVWSGRGPALIPAPAGGYVAARLNPWEVWLPSLPALLVVTACLKEFAGMAGLAIIH